MCYVILAFLYKMYLNEFNQNIPVMDDFSVMVSNQSAFVLNKLKGEEVASLENTPFYIKFFYNHNYVANITEGCNVLSIIILFISFIIAFTGKLKHTIGFIIGGSLLIYIINILRISFLILLIYYFPQMQNFWHNVVFPLIIYGLVLILWIVWIKKFSLNLKK
ncbi:MAG: exosortase family protein XrtF [Flavobacterium sp.]